MTNIENFNNGSLPPPDEADKRPAAGNATSRPATAPVHDGADHGPAEPPKGRNPATLREGFTTGSAATAAAMAATRVLLGHAAQPHELVPLPPFAQHESPAAPRVHPEAAKREAAVNTADASAPVTPAGTFPPSLHLTGAGTLRIPVQTAQATATAVGTATDVDPDTGPDTGPDTDTGTQAQATVTSFPIAGTNTPMAGATAIVIKDGGDDPDATHNARIVAHVRPLAHLPAAHVEIAGGVGVGTVTLPGLPIGVGEAAINPEPRRQIAAGVRSVAAALGCLHGLHVTISVPDGAAIARHTLNPRLGIVDGISILGTRGTVRPYSHDAWQASIAQGLDVARAAGLAEVCLSTGRRSETLLMARYPHLCAQGFVQAADFAAFSLRTAAEKGFTHIAWGCFFGKLVKLAQGLSYTHARTAPLDLNQLAHWSAQNHIAPERCAAIATCNTASQALEIILPDPAANALLAFITCKARTQAEGFAGGRTQVTVHLFHMNGTELVTA